MPTKPTNHNRVQQPRPPRLTFADGTPAGARQRAALHHHADKRVRLHELLTWTEHLQRNFALYLSDFEEENLYLVAAVGNIARTAGQVRQRMTNLAELERMAARHGVPYADTADE